MLALTRKVGESIEIGDPQSPLGTITIVAVHGDKVRLGFELPRTLQVNRSELAEEKRRSGTKAVQQP